MSATFPTQTLVKAASRTRVYLFDFSNFDEIQDGETIASVSCPAVSGLTIGTPTVTTTVKNFIPAGQAVQVSIDGGTVNTDYNVKVIATTSGGSELEVRGVLAVR